MKNYLTLIVFTFSLTMNAQTDEKISIFHRLMILNSNNELLVVKIKNTDFWVTPGFYQNHEQTIKQGLDSIATSYGIKLKKLSLNGVFLLKRVLNDKTSTSLRNVFIGTYSHGKLKRPEGIEQIKWLSKDKALGLITFPHINLMIAKILSDRNQVFAGTLLQYKEHEKWESKILDDFYSLSNIKIPQ